MKDSEFQVRFLIEWRVCNLSMFTELHDFTFSIRDAINYALILERGIKRGLL